MISGLWLDIWIYILAQIIPLKSSMTELILFQDQFLQVRTYFTHRVLIHETIVSFLFEY